ncbi:hypothetical protein NDU88_007940 [Pleurodeles waltl]|uniref:Uncharacterized protein n=1 Tax=Pleurodeles waltl TaxID=8319 RepID=A0AAV7VVU6_PLEWA|nr:hypothetical protein NDU88_007940 [Pleurodeles waltl]
MFAHRHEKGTESSTLKSSLSLTKRGQEKQRPKAEHSLRVHRLTRDAADCQLRTQTDRKRENNRSMPKHDAVKEQGEPSKCEALSNSHSHSMADTNKTNNKTQ